MNILRQSLLQQVALRNGLASSVYRMQWFQIHTSHHESSPLNLRNTKCICSITTGSLLESAPKRGFFSKAQSLLDKFIKKIKTQKSVIRGKAYLVYTSAVDSINHAEFYEKFKMPNTFNTWFLVTEIHVGLLMAHSMGERENGKLIRDNIVASMWSDIAERSTKMAPESKSVLTKQVKELSDLFNYAIIAYDEGLTTDDKHLASARWIRFFVSNCDYYEHIELMVKYIRINIAQLDKMNTDEFLTKRIFVWPALKDIESGKY